MLTDAAAVPAGAVLTDHDVCVVGAGPAGLSAALELAGRGVRVLLLEGGGLEEDRADRRLLRGTSVGYPHLGAEVVRGRGFGGSSLRWAAEGWWQVRPLDPVDFEERPELGLPGWPFDRADLEPFYERAQRVCGMGPYTYDPADWASPATEPLDLPDGLEHVLFQLDHRDFRRYRAEVERAAGLRALTRATVLRLSVGDDGRRVVAAEVRTRAGHRFEVRAPLFVLAAGTLENARLLLLSRGRGEHAEGLGNANDLVGRYYLERLAARSGEIELERRDLLDRLRFYDLHDQDGRRLRGGLRLPDEVLRREGLLNGIFLLIRRSAGLTAGGARAAANLRRGLERSPWLGDTGRHLAAVARDAPALARLAARRLRGDGDPGGRLLVRLQFEQSPNPASRITLDPVRRDGHGQPRVVVDWRIDDRDRRSIRRSQELVDEILARAGVGRLVEPLGSEDPPVLFEGMHHNLGTTRMHPDPRRGVVDADGRVHGVDNLYVTGGSVFPTAGASNPTLTIVALALRLADHLSGRLSARDGAGTMP